MKKEKEKKSKFLKVSCPDCEAEKIVFDHASSEVRCNLCNKLLVSPGASKADIYCRIIESVD